MQRVHQKVRRSIFSVLDIFYPMFRKLMPIKTYHYAACGGANTLLSFIIYSLSFNFLFSGRMLDLGFITLKAHTAALFLAFLITFPIGFYLSMFVIFEGSTLHRKVQFIRYFIVIIGCMIINYVFLQLFVQTFHWNPTFSQVPATVIVILFNYFAQRHFSFRGSAAYQSTRSVKTSG